MANIEEAIRRLQFLYETHGAEEVAAAQRAITASTTTTEKASLSLEKSFNNLERRYISTVRAQQDYNRVAEKVNDAIKQNPALAERGNAVMQAAQAQYIRAAQGAGTYSQAVQQTADSSRLARHEMINLSRQIQDIGVSLASGQSPLTVAIQQGAQIADVFATSSGTVMGFFRQFGGWAVGFAKSAAGMATAAGTALAAWLVAGAQFKSGQNDIERALAGIGAASGVTSKQINEIASASSSAFGLSTSEARTAATAFAATGRIYGDNVKLATKTVSDFAKATGTDAADATKALAAAMVDPAKGAVELNKQFNFLDATQLNYIRTLQAQGQEQEAQKALMDALIPKLQKMAEHTSLAGKAWDAAANAASNFWSYAGKAAPLGPSIPAPWEAGAADPKEERLKLMSTDADAASRSIMGVRAQIEALQQQLSKLSRFSQGGGAMTADMINAVNVGQIRLQQLRDEEQALARQAEWTQQIAALHPGISIEVAKQLELMNGQLAVAQTRTAAEQMIVQQFVTQIDLLAQGKTAEEASTIAAQQRAIAEANVARNIADQIYGLDQQIELSRARINGTEAAVKAEQAYNDALRQGASELDAQALKSKTRKAADQQAAEQRASDYDGETHSLGRVGSAIDSNTAAMKRHSAVVHQVISLYTEMGITIAGALARSRSYLESQVGPSDKGPIEGFSNQAYDAYQRKVALERVYGAENIEPVTRDMGGIGGQYTDYRLKADYKPPVIGTKYQTDLNEKLNNNLENLTASTDSLNATMQSALSPFYSQDPRTTKLGFRAGTVGNQDWMTGAGNANPLIAVLGPGATAPGMAGGGSFTVGGGYSANDNRMAVFPVASGEEIVVNRNREGRGGQVVNIDNRIIVTGSVDADALGKMKVSRYQQAQRMRAGMSQA
jgi:hypothetical protein